MMYYDQNQQQTLLPPQDLLQRLHHQLQHPNAAFTCSLQQNHPLELNQHQYQLHSSHQQQQSLQPQSHQMPRSYDSSSSSTSNHHRQRVDTPPSSSSSTGSLSPTQLQQTTSNSNNFDNNNNNGSNSNTDNSTTTTRRSQRASKSKRVRTIFTPEQLKRLEQEFSNQMYLVGHDRGLLAKSLNLTEAQVKVWFQNRRIKFRKLNPGPLPPPPLDDHPSSLPHHQQQQLHQNYN